MSDFELREWQQVVVNFVKAHDEMYNEESMVALSNYAKNKECSIRVAFPRQSGHTTLAGYLASTMPNTLIYSDLNHYKMLKHFADDAGLKDGFENADCISIFHIYHDIVAQSRSNIQSDALSRLKLRLSSPEGHAVIVDNATQIFEAHPEILDWIYSVANGPVVILG